MQFIEQTGLFIIPFSIFDTEQALNNPKAFRKNALYVGMKNLATGLEDFIREIAKQIPHATGRTDTLDSLLNLVFDSWYSDFQRARGNRARPATAVEFIDRIVDAYTDPFLAITQRDAVRVFLITNLARNMTGHYYTLEDDLYSSSLYGIVFTAMYHALLYTWKHALNQRWVI